MNDAAGSPLATPTGRKSTLIATLPIWLLAPILATALLAVDLSANGAAGPPAKALTVAVTPTVTPTYAPPGRATASFPHSAFWSLFVLAALLVLPIAWQAQGASLHQAALLAVAPAFPLAASIITAVVYLVRDASWHASALGLAVALVVCCGAALCFRGFATVARCNQTSYGELKNRLTQLHEHLEAAEKAMSDRTAFKLAKSQAEVIKQKLEDKVKDGLPWLMETAYIILWERLHRAEEAVIEVLPKETAIAQALRDELRLADSTIEKSADLLAKLRRAVVALEPSAKSYLKLSADEASQLDSFLEKIKTAPHPHQSEAEARAILRELRRILNEYQDGLYGRFVTTRNRTWGTMILTGLVVYGLLTTATIAKAPQPAVIAGLVFFLVGATVGLLNRLRGESEDPKDILDYGLSAARLCSAPLYCGLAAVGGVVLTAILPVAGSVLEPGAPNSRQPAHAVSAVATPIAAQAAPAPSKIAPADIAEAQPTPGAARGSGGNHAPRELPSLARIFDLSTNVVGILAAAIFGLTPALFFGRLQQQSDKFKSELKSTDATQGKGAK